MTECRRCGEAILPGDDRAPVNEPLHFECGFRAVGGGANHLLKQCSCCGGTLAPDPVGFTKREAAKIALAIWRELNDQTSGRLSNG